MKQLVRFLKLSSLLLLLSSNLFAQNFSTKGTDFWLGYMENYSGPTLYIYISSDIATSGIINMPLQGWSQNFTVAANSTVQITIPTNLAQVTTSDVIEGKGIHITANDPVTVYALNYEAYTSDAAIILPTNTLGVDYYAVNINPAIGTGTMPSEVLIVATSNNTVIQITPTATTDGGNAAGVPFNITLNQGQTYQLKSNGQDLTGTTVKSVSAGCKRFALFAGVRCTDVGGCHYCDHLYEEMYPTSTWGKKYITTPYLTRSGDIFRIIAKQNNTTYTINGGAPTTINAGQFSQILLSSASYIDADAPIMVMQYSRGQDCDGANADPFMIVLSPIEQTLKDITFNAFTSSVISSYYVNIISKTTATSSVLLDGSPVGGLFSTVPANTSYSFARIGIGQGNHTINSDSGIIAYVYGYGAYESYGYVAGASLNNLNANFQIVAKGDTISYDQIPFAQLCPNTMINFMADTSSNILGYDWDFGDSNTASGANVNHTYPNTGAYTVSLTIYISNICSVDTVSINQIVNIQNTPPSTIVFPNPATICPGDSVLLTITGPTNSSYSWSNGDTTISIKVSPPFDTTYTVTTVNYGCIQIDTAKVIVNNPTTIPACNVVYVTTTGTGIGTQVDPTDFLSALAMSTCNGAVIRMAIGTYLFNNPITSITSFTTIEGGFDPSNNWQKTSLAGATIIKRSSSNLEGPSYAPRLTTIYLNGIHDFRLQDLTITTVNAPTAPDSSGISTYGVYLTGCFNYNIVRCQLFSGNASAGKNGIVGTTGGSGTNGGVGGFGDEDGTGSRSGGAGGIVAWGSFGGNGGNSGSGNNNGAGGTSGFGGTPSGGGGSGTSSNGCPGCVFSGAGMCGRNASNGSNGTIGSSGINGTQGTFSSFFFLPGGKGNLGFNGTNGNGGGGGGGGGGQGCFFCVNGAGGGGGGGGAGGQGGNGGQGGYGGGGSFALVLINNSSNGKIIDSYINAGSIGTGGTGGVGGVGGTGGSGGSGGNFSGSGGCPEVGTGGSGGTGGVGGAGGAGGSGISGIKQNIYSVGGVPLVIADSIFNLATQPVIKVDNVTCTANQTQFYSNSNTWNLGNGANPMTVTGDTVVTQYDSTGFQTILYGSDTYTGFVNIIVNGAGLSPQITTNVQQFGGEYHACKGSYANFQSILQGINYTYYWNFNGATTPDTFAITTPNLDSLLLDSVGIFNITLQIETPCCGLSIFKDTITLYVDSLPTPQIVTTDSICYGDTVSLTASGGLSYLWDNGDTTSSITVSPLSTTMYHVQVNNYACSVLDSTLINVTVNTLYITGGDKICAGDSTTLTANSPSGATFQWTGGITDTSQNIIVAPTINTSYQLVSNLNGCLAYDSVTVIVQGVLASIVGDTAICLGDTASLTSLGGNIFLWSTGDTTSSISITPTLTTNYYVIVSWDSIGATPCSNTIDTAYFTVTVNTSNISVNTSNTSICNGNSVVLTATGGATYLWNTGDTTSSITVSPSNNTSYTVVAISNQNCYSIQDTINVTVSPSPTLSLDSVINASCHGLSDGAAYISVIGGTSPYAYQWSNGSTSLNMTNVPVGNYTVLVIDSNGCRDSLATVIWEPDSVIALFTASPDSGVVPLTVNFLNNSTGGQYYNWTFTDSSIIDTTKNPTYVYTNGGVYNVTLVVSNQFGCTDTVNYTITIIGKAILLIPNVFSPNNDGINDQFYIKSSYLKNLQVTIFNRWGEEIYQITTPNQRWDGMTISGVKVPEGTYFYILKAEGYDNQVFDKKGSITLLR